MKTSSLLLALASVLLFITVPARADATVGQTAPDFTLTGADGKTHSLSDYTGKYIVLEWTNPNCPFVKKFYGSGAMQKLQKDETAQGVVWLRINSGAPGNSSFQSPVQLAAYVTQNNVAATQSLIDPTGKVGHLYGAHNTPQMFVIDPKGVLIYAGGIDDHPSADPADIAGAKNYVTAALDQSRAGQPVAVPTAPPYGCSVKYASE